jgi:hypothetical protein
LHLGDAWVRDITLVSQGLASFLDVAPHLSERIPQSLL